MRKLITLLAVLVAALAMIPASASAYGTALHKYGIGTRGGDLLFVTSSEVSIAATNDWHIRALIDCGRGDPATIYGAKLDELADARISILPIIGWKDGNGWHAPANQTERNQFATCAANIANTINFVYTGSGWTGSNVYEIWNEPNCGNGISSYTQFYNSVYAPAALGIRGVDSDANLVPGGFAFGTAGSNGCEDASGWIAFWEAAGYGGITNAYSVHPYGYTNAANATREATSAQTAAKASSELARAMQNTSKPVMATEFGRRTDTFSQSSQAGYLDAMDDSGSGGIGEAALLSNWTGQDAPAGGIYTSGLLDTSGAQKLAYGVWNDHNTAAGVGTLPN
jgi:hypothetical protein